MSENENAKTAGAPVGSPVGVPVGPPAGTLLVEARTEELPPQLLRDLKDNRGNLLPGLGNQFPDRLLTNLKQTGFADDKSFRETDDGKPDGNPKLLATPRRVVALLRNIRRAAADRTLVRRGPQVTAALDKDGRPTKALEGFLRATGKTVGDLRKLTERGREYFAVDLRESGGTLDDRLAAIVQESLLSLNAPRLMRWGGNDWRFIRPLRGLAMLWESEAIAGEVMGVRSSRTTLGHRFMSEGPVGIPSAGEYEKAMEKGRVMVGFNARVQEIASKCNKVASEFGGQPLGPTFADYRTFPRLDAFNAALSEFPRVYCGEIFPEFMSVPDDCFNLCLRKHQHCFPMETSAHERLPRFLYVADNAPENEAEMTRGFERVVAARLADVAFYLAEDRKISLEENREKMKRIVYHEKLGSQFDRAERIRAIAAKIGMMMNLAESERENLDQAALVCKADLPTLMVGEYPELEGVMAAEYYAGDNAEVREIVRKQNPEPMDYPAPPVLCLQLANFMEKIAGMFSAGEKPTGDKDPHGLRGMAAYVANALLELGDLVQQDGVPIPRPPKKNLQVREVIAAALSSFPDSSAECVGEIYDYLAERVRQNPMLTMGGRPTELDAILSRKPQAFSGILPKLNALDKFKQMPEAAVLVEANKRVNNIFRKSGVALESLPKLDGSLFEQDEERELSRAVEAAARKNKILVDSAETAAKAREAQECYQEALESLAAIAAPVDAFFDKVMVNADDEKVRANRFALLAELRALLNQVADISKLAG